MNMAGNTYKLQLRPDLSAGSVMKFRIKKSILCHLITNSEFSEHQRRLLTFGLSISDSKMKNQRPYLAKITLVVK